MYITVALTALLLLLPHSSNSAASEQQEQSTGQSADESQPADTADASTAQASTEEESDLDTLLSEDEDSTAQSEGDDDTADLLTDPSADDESLLKDDENLLDESDQPMEEEAGPYSPDSPVAVLLPCIGQIQCIPPSHSPNTAPRPSCMVGRISLSDLEGSITKKGNLALKGKCSIKGEEGSISVERWDEKEAELKLKCTYEKPFEFDILPGQKTSLQSFDLTLSPTEQELSGKVALFSGKEKDTTITFGLMPDQNEARASVDKEIPFTSIAPSAKGNKDAEKISLSNVTLSFPNPLDPAAAIAEAGGIPAVSIEASAKLDEIVLYGSTHLSNSDATIRLQGTSISFDAQGTSPIVLDSDVTLDAPQISIDVAQGGGAPDLGISGTLISNLPVVGELKTPVSGRKSMGSFELIGKLSNSFDFGPVTFRDPQIRIETSGSGGEAEGGRSLNLEVFASFDMFGLSITPKLKFLKPGASGAAMSSAAQAAGNKRVVMFSGEINGGKPIKPLGLIPGLQEIPGIKDFIIETARLGIDSTKKTFIGGRTNILGLAVDAKVALTGVKSVMGSFTKPWKISDSIKQLKGTVFDSFRFENVSIGYSAGQHLDPETGMLVQRGLNIIGSLDTSQGIFQKIRTICGPILPKRLDAAVTIRPNPRDCMVQVGIPLDLKLSSRVSLHNLVFEISGAPSFAIQLSIKVIVGKTEPPLLFTGRLEFDPGYFEISGSMNGTWRHPFGIPGITVSNVAVEAAFPYGLIPPVGFGITGAVVLGDIKAMLAVKLSPDTIMAIAEINKWPLFALPALLRMVGLNLGPLDVLKAIDIGFYDLKFKFAPTGGQIGTIYFDAGIGASGKLVLNIPYIIKAKLDAGFNIDWMSGFKLWAKMPKFNLGPLKITGKGPDRKWNTADDGPIFYATLSLTEQRIFVSALAELFGSSSEIEIDVGLTHLRFKMLMKLLGLLDAHIIGETYHKGWRVGFKAMGTAKISNKAEITLFGDINTLGCNFAGKYDALTLHDIAELCHLPSEFVPEFGITEAEFYINAQGG